MKIRGHHFLCIEGFRGKGYSSDFVENMKSVIDTLKKDPIVIPVDFPDIICLSCPHYIDGICKNPNGGEEEVLRMDREFSKRTSIVLNKNYSYFQIREVIYDVFKKKDDLFGICDRCSWNRICVWYQTRKD